MALLFIPHYVCAEDSWQWIQVRSDNSNWLTRHGTIEVRISDKNQIFGSLLENNKKVADIGGHISNKLVKLTVSWHGSKKPEKYKGVVHHQLIDPFDYPQGLPMENREIYYRLFNNDVFLYLRKSTNTSTEKTYNKSSNLTGAHNAPSS